MLDAFLPQSNGIKHSVNGKQLQLPTLLAIVIHHEFGCVLISKALQIGQQVTRPALNSSTNFHQEAAPG
jgi:hypothetical protein